MKNNKTKKVFVIGIILIILGVGLFLTDSIFVREERIINDFEKGVRNVDLKKISDCVDEKSAQDILATKKYFQENKNGGIEDYVFSIIGVEYADLDTFSIVQGDAKIIDNNSKLVPCLFTFNKDGRENVIYRELTLVNENGTYYIYCGK